MIELAQAIERALDAVERAALESMRAACEQIVDSRADCQWDLNRQTDEDDDDKASRAHEHAAMTLEGARNDIRALKVKP